jgi:hypothetical protein
MRCAPSRLRARPSRHPSIASTKEKSPSPAPALTSPLVLRGEMAEAIGFPIGAKAVLSADERGDITLTRMGLVRPRKLRVLRARS